MAFLSIDQAIAVHAWGTVEYAKNGGYLPALHSRCKSFGTEVRIQHLSRTLAQLYADAKVESRDGAATCLFNAIDQWRTIRGIAASVGQPEVDKTHPLLWQVFHLPITQYGLLMDDSLQLIETIKQYSSRPGEQSKNAEEQ